MCKNLRDLHTADTLELRYTDQLKITHFKEATVALLIPAQHTDRRLTCLSCVPGRAACLGVSRQQVATCSCFSVLKRSSTLNFPSDCTAPSSSTEPSAASVSCSCTSVCWRRRASPWSRSRTTSRRVWAPGVACDTDGHYCTVLGNVFCTLEKPQWAISDYRGLNTVSTTNRHYYYYYYYYYHHHHHFEVTCFDQRWSSSLHQNQKRCSVQLHYVVLIAEIWILNFIKYMSQCCSELSVMNTK